MVRVSGAYDVTGHVQGINRRGHEDSQGHTKQQGARAFSNFSIWYFSAILGPVSVFSGLLPFLRILLPKLSM